MRLRPSALLFCLLLHRAQAQRPALAPRGRPKRPTEPPKRELRESEPTARTSSDVAALLASSLSSPSEWYDYLTRVSESLEDAVETVSDSTSNFMFRDILGYRVGWARTRRLALLFSRMLLGAALLLHGGSGDGRGLWTRGLALLQASQIVSFLLTSGRTIVGIPRVRLYVREALVLGAAAGILHVPRLHLPALVLGVNAGKTTRGLVRATRLTSAEQDSLSEQAFEAAEEALDELSDTVSEALGVDDWWDDEPTAAEAELAHYRLIGRTLSPLVAALTFTAVARRQAPFGAVPAPMVSAAVAGGFMLQRNIRLALEENWLYLRLFLLRSIPAILRFSLWLLWHVVLPIRNGLHGLRSLLERRLLRPLYSALCRLVPALRRVPTPARRAALAAADGRPRRCTRLCVGGAVKGRALLAALCDGRSRCRRADAMDQAARTACAVHQARAQPQRPARNSREARTPRCSHPVARGGPASFSSDGVPKALTHTHARRQPTSRFVLFVSRVPITRTRGPKCQNAGHPHLSPACVFIDARQSRKKQNNNLSLQVPRGAWCPKKERRQKRRKLGRKGGPGRSWTKFFCAHDRCGLRVGV